MDPTRRRPPQDCAAPSVLPRVDRKNRVLPGKGDVRKRYLDTVDGSFGCDRIERIERVREKQERLGEKAGKVRNWNRRDCGFNGLFGMARVRGEQDLLPHHS